MNKPNKHFLKAQHEFVLKRYDKSILILDKLLGKDSKNKLYLNLKGEACLRSENYDSALTIFAQLVELDNSNPVYLNNFSVALIRSRKYSEAKEIIEYLIQLEPINLGAYINLCSVYQALNQPEEALKKAFKAIEIDPLSSMAYNNLGTALGDLHMVEEARQALLTAIQISPDNIPTLINLAQIEEKLENRREAINLYEKALTYQNITPGEAHLIKYYLAYSYLFYGELEKGWKHYDFGFGALLPVGALRSPRKFIQPKWEGEPLQGKRLLVWREQGLGDEIDFSTCLHDLTKIECQVILECDHRLIDVYKRSFPQFIIRGSSATVDGFQLADDFEYHTPLGSLPKFLRSDIAAFDNQPILFTPLKEKKDEFMKRLVPYRNKICVGISWRSGKLSVARNENYTSLTDWKELLIQPDMQFVNLQYGEPEKELLQIENELGIKILRWDDVDLKNDVESILALCSSLDCVISVGTAVSSIAPAVGTKTFLLTKQSWIMLGQTDRFLWQSTVTPLTAGKGEHVASKLIQIPKLIRSHGSEYKNRDI